MKTTVERRTVDLTQYPDLVVIYLGMRVNRLAGRFCCRGVGRRLSARLSAVPPARLDGPAQVSAARPSAAEWSRGTRRWGAHSAATEPDHVLILNEQHLRIVLAEFVAYYSTDRPHCSLALKPPLPACRSPVPSGMVRSRPVLGGLHHVYSRAA